MSQARESEPATTSSEPRSPAPRMMPRIIGSVVGMVGPSAHARSPTRIAATNVDGIQDSRRITHIVQTLDVAPGFVRGQTTAGARVPCARDARPKNVMSRSVQTRQQLVENERRD